MTDNGTPSEARIAVSSATRDMVRSKKRGGETYDQLLQKMVEQYDPNEAGPGS